MNKLRKFHFRAWHFGLLFVTLLVLTNILDAMTINNTPKVQDSNFVELSDKTFEDAIASSEVCFILFYKKDCPLCDKMEYNLNELSEKQNIKFYKLDFEEYPKKYNDYHISGTPTVSIYKNGKEVERIMGVVPVSNLEIINNRIIK